MRKILGILLALSVSTTLNIGVATSLVAKATNPPAATSTAPASTSSLQAQLDANDQQIAQLTAQIAEYRKQILQAGADKKTLQDAINALDLRRKNVEAQVSLTQAQIKNTQLQVQRLGGEIAAAQETIQTDQSALAASLRELQKEGEKPLLFQLLSSGSITDAWDHVSAVLQVQNAVRKNTEALEAHKSVLTDSKSASEQKQVVLASQQKDLSVQQKTLTVTVQSKAQLLADTKAKQSNYEKLLAAAEAELNAFTAFTNNTGGTKLLGSQTVCDSWGCYYNQRDSAWGNNSLNGTRFTLASAGCLVTSMAMVLTHYGHINVTPQTINSNPNNFAAYYPALLMNTIYVDGQTVARKTAVLDSILAGGNPAIVGLHAFGGTHFIVIVSGSHGNYVMRDPDISGGKDISFNAHYSVRSIYSTARVLING